MRSGEGSGSSVSYLRLCACLLSSSIETIYFLVNTLIIIVLQFMLLLLHLQFIFTVHSLPNVTCPIYFFLLKEIFFLTSFLQKKKLAAKKEAWRYYYFYSYITVWSCLTQIDMVLSCCCARCKCSHSLFLFRNTILEKNLRELGRKRQHSRFLL